MLDKRTAYPHNGCMTATPTHRWFADFDRYPGQLATIRALEDEHGAALLVSRRDRSGKVHARFADDALIYIYRAGGWCSVEDHHFTERS